MLHDLRYALRVLGRSKAFALIAVLSLALGIGANATIFSIVNAFLLRPPPFREPGRLVTVHATDASGRGFGSFSYPDFADYRARNRTLADLAAYRTLQLQVGTGSDVRTSMGNLVSGNYFDVLGVRAALGRTFTPDEDRVPGAAPVAVIGHRLWRERFSGDPAVIGAQVVLNGHVFTVIGVLPPEFTGPMVGLVVDAWVPAAMAEAVRMGRGWLTDRGGGSLELIGRLRPGATRAQALADLNAVAQSLQRDYPLEGRGRRVNVVQAGWLFPQMRTPVTLFGTFLMAIVGLVLLAACTNLANLLLARATSRRREIGIRLALGAGRPRLVRQLLTESVLLALLGGAAGLLLALWAADAMMAFQPPFPATIFIDLSPDARVLGFTLGVSLLTGVLFGLAPAIQATRPDVVRALKDESPGFRTRPEGTRRLRGALVVAQVSVSLVLLVAAGLFVRSLRNAHLVDVGFGARTVLLTELNPGLQGYTREQGLQYYERLLEQVGALPGVRAASLAELVPLGLSNAQTAVWTKEACCERGARLSVDFQRVAPRYFEAMGVSLLRGREFTSADRDGAPPVAIVNEAAARRLWGSADAVGKRLRVSGQDSGFAEVVAVARTGKYRSLGEEERPYVYLPFLQWYSSGMTLHVRTEGDPLAVLPGVRQVTESLDARVPMTGTVTMTEHLRIALFPARVAGTLLGLFGAVALALAAIGVYGVISYAVAQRTREIGVRMALGASGRNVVRLVVGQGMRPVMAGVAVGLLLAVGLARLVAGLLYGISPTDPLTFAAVPALLAAVALLAVYVPARRATRVDPMVALRSE